ncbi:WecB/TagA/CpsF family glycosyltransferase [bacterium]|nr:WecB/TagA/CpsF family glycosyltransferase [bacterium]
MANVNNSKTVNLLGFNINNFSMYEALDYALELIKSGKGGQIVTINPEMIQSAKKKIYFKQVIQNADLVIPDGVGIKIGLKLKNIDAKRIAGIEFSYKMLEKCAQQKIPVALIGAKPHVVYGAVNALQKQIPNLKTVYFHNGYFSDEERVIKEMKKAMPKFVLVALGSPRQEYFIQNALKDLPDSVMIGVGGSFDVWSGNVKRAPEFYQKYGLEWLYRTIKEPKRLKRIFPTLPNFVLNVIKEDVLKIK